MQLHPADERDCTWEHILPTYRVFHFRGGDVPGHSWSVETTDLTDSEVHEVIAWAEQAAGDDGLYAVALVLRDEDETGVVYLIGVDANDDRDDPSVQRLYEAMRARRGSRVIAGS